MSKITKEIEYLRKKMGYSQISMGEILGCTDKTYSKKVENGEGFTYQNIDGLIHHLFGILRGDSALYEYLKDFPMLYIHAMMIDQDDMLFGAVNNSMNLKSKTSLHVNTIPLYPSLKASYSCGSAICNCDIGDVEQIQLPKEYLREYLGINSINGVHAIIADGESMEPTIKHGDIIFVSPCEAIKDGKVYIININDETYCKRVYKDLETGGLILRSDNPVAPEIKLSTTRILDMKIIGRVGVVLSRVVL